VAKPPRDVASRSPRQRDAGGGGCPRNRLGTLRGGCREISFSRANCVAIARTDDKFYCCVAAAGEKDWTGGVGGQVQVQVVDHPIRLPPPPPLFLPPHHSMQDRFSFILSIFYSILRSICLFVFSTQVPEKKTRS